MKNHGLQGGIVASAEHPFHKQRQRVIGRFLSPMRFLFILNMYYRSTVWLSGLGSVRIYLSLLISPHESFKLPLTRGCPLKYGLGSSIARNIYFLPACLIVERMNRLSALLRHFNLGTKEMSDEQLFAPAWLDRKSVV